MQLSIKKVISSTLLKFLFVALGSSFFAQTSFAAAMYYTFAGEVTYADRATGVDVGEEVSYTYLVDRDQSGNGSSTFYAEFVSGGAMESPFGTTSYEPWNYGYETSGGLAQIVAGDWFNLSSASSNDSEKWSVGSLWRGYEDALVLTSKGFQFVAVRSALVLESISPKSVPELDAAGAPLALALIAGLAGLGMERRRKKVRV